MKFDDFGAWKCRAIQRKPLKRRIGGNHGKMEERKKEDWRDREGMNLEGIRLGQQEGRK
jgi:hypothetical protein